MARNPIIYGLASEIYVAESSDKGGTWSGVTDQSLNYSDLNSSGNFAVQDFQGLSPRQVQTLMHDPFSRDCAVKLKTAILPEVSSSPVMRISQVILSSIPDVKGLKLTVKGNLPRKVVEEIRSLKVNNSTSSSFFDDRVVNEQDYMPAIYSRALLTAS